LRSQIVTDGPPLEAISPRIHFVEHSVYTRRRHGSAVVFVIVRSDRRVSPALPARSRVLTAVAHLAKRRRRWSRGAPVPASAPPRPNPASDATGVAAEESIGRVVVVVVVVVVIEATEAVEIGVADPARLYPLLVGGQRLPILLVGARLPFQRRFFECGVAMLAVIQRVG
jgi:hypothetical protein